MLLPEGLVKLILSAVGGAVALKLLLVAAGFTAGGIATGSLAAAWHASIGNVVGGSLFAGLQALGAGPILGWILLGAAIGVSGYLLYRWWHSGGREQVRRLFQGLVRGARRVYSIVRRWMAPRLARLYYA